MNREKIREDIEVVFERVVTVIGGINEKQLNEVPFEGSWTVGQVAEHIVICSRGIPDNEVKQADRPFDLNVDALTKIFQNMEEKSEADPAVSPHPPPHKKEDLSSQIRNNKEKLISIAKERDLTELSLGMEFPGMGYLTRYEWLSFICLHTQRHLNQINNIKQQLEPGTV